MPFDDDEVDEPTAGGLPDPSTRHWRHPSELSQLGPWIEPVAPKPESALSTWPLTGVLGGFAVLAAVGLLGLGLAPGTGSMDTATGQRSLTPLPDGASSVLYGDGDRALASNRSIPTTTATSTPPDNRSVTTTIVATVAPPIDTGPNTSVVTDPASPGPDSATDDLPPASDPIGPVDGLVPLFDGPGPNAPIAALATSVDGMVVASAVALASVADPHLFDGTTRRPLIVVVADAPTGLAVLAPRDGVALPTGVVHRPATEPLWEGAIVSVANPIDPTVGSPVDPSGQPGPDNPTRTEPETDPGIKAEAEPDATTGTGTGPDEDPEEPGPRPEPAIHGEVFSLGQPVRLTNRRAVYEPIQTSISAWPMQAGTPLLDQDGRLAGVVLDSATTHVVAIPIGRVRDLVAVASSAPNRPWWADRSIAPAGDEGLLVAEVPPGLGGAAGLEPGDRIVDVWNDRLLRGTLDDGPDRRDVVLHLLRSAREDRPVTVVVERQGREIEIELGPIG